MKKSPQRGRRVDSAPEQESDHYMRCQACGQPIDLRDLAQVIHHATSGHTRTDAHA